MKKFLFGGADIKSGAANFGLLIMRLYAGFALAFVHGIHKLPPTEKFIEGVAKMGLPYPDAFSWAAAISEFVGGICIALGLGTRIWAFLISCTMATAVFKHVSTGNGDPELAASYFAIFFALMMFGGGKFAVDRRFA